MKGMDMKTNVIMKSSDRNLFGITVEQETATCFMSLTDLFNAYEIARAEHGWSAKRSVEVLRSTTATERIYYLLKEHRGYNESLDTFKKVVEEVGIATFLKSLNVYKTKGSGANRKVYCDPYIWVLIALELNPMVYAKVVGWLTDSLIMDRVEAGDKFKPMNDAINKIIKEPLYYKYAIAINEKVFGKHYTGIRNFATKDQLKQIGKIEEYVVNIINDGFVKTESEIIRSINNFKL